MVMRLRRSRIGVAIIGSVVVAVGAIVTSPGTALAARPSATGILSCYTSGSIKTSPRLSNTSTVRRFTVRATLDCKSIEGYPGTGGITSGKLIARRHGSPTDDLRDVVHAPATGSLHRATVDRHAGGQSHVECQVQRQPRPELSAHALHLVAGPTHLERDLHAGRKHLGSAGFVLGWQSEPRDAAGRGGCGPRRRVHRQDGPKLIAFGAFKAASRVFVQSYG